MKLCNSCKANGKAHKPVNGMCSHEYQKEYYQEHKKEACEYQKEYQKKRRMQTAGGIRGVRARSQIKWKREHSTTSISVHGLQHQPVAKFERLVGGILKNRVGFVK